MALHSWYKFFSERKYAEAFLDGSVLFRSLAYFRDYEDAQIIGDRYEGTRTWMPEGGVILRGRQTGAVGKFMEPFAFNAIVNPEDISVFCVSNSLTERLTREFKAVACVEVVNKCAFFSRLTPSLPPNAKLISGRVGYYDKDDSFQTLMGASPEKIILSKLKQFLYQEEYRFAFSTTNALDVGSARYCLREFKPAPNPGEHHSNLLQLGTLRDICKLHEFGE